MPAKVLLARDIVKAHCAACRAIENHTVVAVAASGTVRMACNHCHAVSVSPAKKAAKPAAARTSGARKKVVSCRDKAARLAAECIEWASLRPGMQVEKALPYELNGSYRARNLLQHPIFGLGLVVREAGPHKIEVLFEGGKKLLCCH